MIRRAVVVLVAAGGACFYLPSEPYTCASDADCAAIFGRCDVTSGTCTTAPVKALDGGMSDAGIPDAAVADAAVPDAAVVDASVPDAALDGGSTDSSVGPSECPGADAGGANRNPVTQPDMATGPEDTSIVVDVLANDCDPDGDTLSVVSVIGSGASRVSVVGNRVKYSPPPDDHRTAVFNYAVDDGNGGTAFGELTIQVTPVNDAPQVQDQRLQYVAPPLLGQLSGVDRDGETLRFIISAPPQHGTVTITDEAQGHFSYTLSPDGGAPPAFDFFTFQAEDPSGALSAPGRVDILIASTVTYDVIWEGDTASAPRAWNEPGNWSTGAVPGAEDSVLIPAGTTQPRLEMSTEIEELLVATGAGLDLVGDVELTVHGSALAFGPIRGVGTVSVDGLNARIGGEFPALRVSASAVLTGPTTVARTAHITAPVTLAGWTLDVGAALEVTGNGSIAMQLPTDKLVCRGPALFAGADASGLATDGVLEIHDVLEVIDRGLAASGNHLTIFTGATTLRMHDALSDLNHVRVVGGNLHGAHPVASTPAVYFINGTMELLGNASLSGDNGITLSIVGDLITAPQTLITLPVLLLQGPQGTTSIQGGLQSDTVILSGTTEQVASSRFSYNNLWVQGPVVAESGVTASHLETLGSTARLTIPGTLQVSTLEVLLNSSVVMQSNDSRVVILGDATFEGAQAEGTMTAGVIEARGNVVVGVTGIVASGTHRLVLGTGMDAERQSLRVTDVAGLGRINNLELRNALGTDIVTRLTVHGEFVTSCANCTDDATSAPEVRVHGPFTTTAGGSSTFATLRLMHPTGTTQIAGTFHAATLILAGSNQALHSGLAYSNITVTGDGAFTDGALSLTGTLLLDSPNAPATPASLSLAGPLVASEITIRDSAVLKTEGHRVESTGALQTQSDGTLETRTPTSTVVVGGDAILWGNNGDALQTNGTLEVGGRLDLSMGTFVAGISHRVLVPVDMVEHEIVFGPTASLRAVEVQGEARISASGTIEDTLNVTGTLQVDAQTTLTVGTLVIADGARVENAGAIVAQMCQLPAAYDLVGSAPMCP